MAGRTPFRLSGAMALKLMRWDVLEYSTPGDYSVKPFWMAIALPLIVCLLMGLFNGLLISKGGMQPFIATLILMVSGRGVAQILTNGKQFTTMYSPFRVIGQGNLGPIPMPIVIMAVVCICMGLFVRKTAFGTFVESVGINPSASRLSGINSRMIILIVFALTGFLLGISGLIYSSRIMSNDSNNAGLNYETDAILSVVIGGTSMSGGKFSLTGTIVGSIIIRTIITFVYYFGVSPDSTMAFKALIIAVIIVLQSEPVRNWMAKRSQARAMVKGGAVK
jgi:simple sugar transport system permease protein